MIILVEWSQHVTPLHGRGEIIQVDGRVLRQVLQHKVKLHVLEYSSAIVDVLKYFTFPVAHVTQLAQVGERLLGRPDDTFLA